MKITQPAAAGDGRQWPQSLRITRQERTLLRNAAREAGGTIAEILRMGLDPLFARLAARSIGISAVSADDQHG
jgi:hypothetical protein